MGTPDFATQSLEALLADGYNVVGVVSQPDRPVGRKRILAPTPVKEVALRHNLPVYQPEKIREPQALEAILEATKPELIVTAAYGQILPKVLLDAPKFGCINVHASLLPKYRGGAPIHASIINGEQESGVTIMYMVEALDAGDMISKVVVPIEETDTEGTLFEKLASAGARLLMETVPKLIAGNIDPQPQNHEEATFAPNIKREAERLDWNMTAVQIYNQVRGMNPRPVAFTTFEGKIWKVWWTEKDQITGILGEPGTIIERRQDGLVVACKEGSIVIKEIQPEGKKRMSMLDFLRGAGASIALGSKVGE